MLPTFMLYLTHISIHALLAESDVPSSQSPKPRIAFLSTLSLRRATWGGIALRCSPAISIHALLAESDLKVHRAALVIMISIHALLAESDHASHFFSFFFLAFLSTLSLRRATLHNGRVNLFGFHFYPRSPCGERLNDAINGCNPDIISIHALLAESDPRGIVSLCAGILFLSTLSLRRATLRVLDGSKSSIISIHALLAESDGGSVAGNLRLAIFLSTLSLRRATI